MGSDIEDHPAVFYTAKLKIGRAQGHINEVHELLTGFFNSDFQKLIIDQHPDTGYYRLEHAVTRDLPAELPLAIGDAVHNLSTALDHMATEIVRATTGESTIGGRVGFPFHQSRDELVKSSPLAAVEKALPGAKDVIVDDIRPYETGNYALWALRKLDNVDKHNLLTPTLQMSSFSGLAIRDANNNRIVNGTSHQYGFGGGHSYLFVSAAPFEIESKPKASFEVLFDKGSYFVGKPVLPTLVALSDEVIRVGKILTRLIVKHGAHPGLNA